MNERTKLYLTDAQVKKTSRRIKAALFRYGHESYAEDCAQEFYCRLLEGKSQHQTIEQFVVDYLRKRFGDKRHSSFTRRSALERANSYEQGEYDRTTQNSDGTTLDDRLDLLGIVHSLRGRDKEIANYRLIWGMDVAEIADRYQITESRICQILERIQSCLSERVTRPRSRFEIETKRAMAKILFGSWQRMEFEKDKRVAFEEPRALEKINGYGYEEWIA